MSAQASSILKSYVRGFITAIVPLIMAGITDWKAIAFAGAAAVIPPALRAIDKNDPMFGLIAHALESKAIKVTHELPVTEKTE